MNTSSSTSRSVTVIDLEDDDYPEKAVCIPAVESTSRNAPLKDKIKSTRVSGADGQSVTPQRNSLHNYFQTQHSSKKNVDDTKSQMSTPHTSQLIQIIDSSEDEVISFPSAISLHSSPAPERHATSIPSTRSSPVPMGKNTFGKKTDLRDYLQPGVPKLPPISDDLDPILLPYSAPLPTFKELNIPNDDLHLTMDEWAQLMVIHDFFHKFSTDILHMEPDVYSYEILEDLICNTCTVNENGIRFICNLIEFIESEEHYQDSPQLPPVSPVNFQWYIGEILPDKSNVFATTEFPEIPPRERLKALNYLVDLALDTDQFSQYLHAGVDERIAQLKKEKRERTETRRQLETQISDLTRNIQAAEKGVVEIQEELMRLAKCHLNDETGDDTNEEDSEGGSEAQPMSHDEGNAEAQEKQRPRDERTSRQKVLAEEKSKKKLVATLKGKCTKLTRDIEKMIRQREGKRKSILELNSKDVLHQSQVEAVSSKYRGGIIPSRGTMATSQEMLLIGYDRYARAYWHWKPLGGIIIEEHKYPQKRVNLGSSVPDGSQDLSAKESDGKVNTDHREPGSKWYYMDDSRQLLLLIRPLNNRGIREKSLRSMLTSIRPMFISSLEKFRSWLKKEIGHPYVQSQMYPESDAAGAIIEEHQLPVDKKPLEDEPAAEKIGEFLAEVSSDTKQEKMVDGAPNEIPKQPHGVVEPTVYIRHLKDSIHQQIDQLGTILFAMIKRAPLPKINPDSMVEEYLKHVKQLFSHIHNISDHNLSKLPVESKKRVRWLRTTNFHEDFDENIKTYSSLNVNLEMCIKDIENYGLTKEEPPEDEHQETSSTKQDRSVNLRDRKARNKPKENVNPSESEDDILIQRRSTRRTTRNVRDDRASNDEDGSRKNSNAVRSTSPERSRKLRTRRTAQQTSNLNRSLESVTRGESSIVTRRTRNSQLKRPRDNEADGMDASISRRKLRPRRDITYNATVDLHES
ncbi:hypothetical protein K493DRAFT_336430 [Basidiobolus meristosporus CBS 931.73]|uniref:WHIM2 domain-containing protein n=1 Tax=Basidiobolus meristosporus CBS 931.73 TaxID=1314790 RepID=A0A1Y1YI51_9FUNG|nr:hypothetical protein K493DRAFT_336430 [Basidiobolus meristosporus CBS 931.73]|eukprot:ORX97710.1 hypothetical protein K493DRAFT_336430 [Basidiobolus meristosporus CBS 931.73]